ncbi:MAG: nucleotidyltransferase domain-containing protein [Erythrobacter sp.]|nr:nucleotidyltransferase domain-containing protein [Erythrobacter sp.]
MIGGTLAISEEDALLCVRDFLGSKGLDETDLLSLVSDTYGEPVLVAATGSIAAGVGNSKSDIDLVVVVPGENVTSFPVTCFKSGVMIDTEYLNSSVVEELFRHVEQAGVATRLLNCDAWSLEFAKLRRLTRISESAVLKATPEWQSKLDQLRSGVLAAACAEFWRIETYRRWVTARWLAPTNGRLACLRMSEALIAAAESMLSTEGQVYAGLKWVSAKAQRSPNTEPLRLVNAAYRASRHWSDDPTGYLRHGGRLLENFLGEIEAAQIDCVLSRHSDVIVEEFGARTLLHRSKLAGAAVKGAHEELTHANHVWRGGSKDVPPPWLMDLLTNNLLWLDILEPTTPELGMRHGA